ncbi:hypothetical protein, partial [Stenotrophomonas maltophilia]|uniref:hypothetical protein n=1 Tax=Stenotrophomonas maltophilia TaxID=40324 RepID=UPI001953E0F1
TEEHVNRHLGRTGSAEPFVKPSAIFSEQRAPFPLDPPGHPPAIRDLALCKPHSQVHGTGRMDARVSPADPSNLAWSECILEADQQGTG